MKDTHASALARQKLRIKLVSHFQIKMDGDIYIYIYIIHNRSLSFLCERNVLRIHITLSPFFPSMKRDEKKNMQPDTFLKPISQAEDVSDMPKMKTF